jgi:anhydro-N-acetylmuramic acid kinase
MNKLISTLQALSSKKERAIIGLMSGTSLDGLDIALCKISGSGPATEARVEAFTSVSYDSETLRLLRAVAFRDAISQIDLAIANDYLGRLYARFILEAISNWGLQVSSIDAIASHGQTVFHAPSRLHGRPGYPNATLQIVDGDHIAWQTGILTVCDFRQKHVAAGGEGAPLAACGDWLLYSKPGVNRIMLNIGGIANFTWLPGRESGNAPFSMDTGPGNTLIDAAIREFFPPLNFDEGGRIGASGNISNELLSILKQHQYFRENPPKTCGPEDFDPAFIKKSVQESEGVSPADLVATLTALTAETIAASVKAYTSPGEVNELLVSGGGVHNQFLMALLAGLLPGYKVTSSADIGLDPDSKEALIFAVLANETLVGEGVPFQAEGTSAKKLSLGKICTPW